MVMRITKFPQSCLLIESGNARLVIDPGSHLIGRFDAEVFGAIDAVCYTHQHADHFEPRLVDPLTQHGARIVTNADVAAKLGEGHEVTVLDDGESTDVHGVRVRAHAIDHCVMVDGSPGPPNTGFVVDDRLLHPGDGIDTALSTELLAAPIAGPSISFRDTYALVAATRASHVVPIHYDGFIADPDRFAQACDIAEVHVLADTNAVEL